MATRKRRRCYITNEVLIEQLQSIVRETGRVPTCTEFDENPNTYSLHAVLRRFDTWKHFVREAGFDPTRRRYSRERLIAQVQQLAKELGRTPMKREFGRCRDTASVYVVECEFNTWNEFLIAAGLPIRRRRYAESRF